jgi:nitrogen fixation protein NifU and related proteins
LPYSKLFKDHLANPRNAGPLIGATNQAEEQNPVCGDRITLYLQISAGKIEKAGFLAYGCPATIACGSALTELLHSSNVDDAKKITRQMLIENIGGLPARKHHAAALAIETLHKTLGNGDVSPR